MWDIKYEKTYFHAALKKYGPDAFIWEQIDTADSREELDAREIYWIAFYNSADKHHGYNLTLGGLGCKHNEATRKKLSASLKGRTTWNKGKKMSPEYCRKLSEAHKGYIIPEEQKRKISEANKGRSSPMKGKHHTPETRRKMSESGKGKRLGKHFSEEQRRKMSEAQLRRFSDPAERRRYSEMQTGRKGKPMPEKTKKAAWEGRKKTFRYSEELVIKIKTALQEGARMCDVAEKYGIAYANIKAIKYGRAYRHVEITAVSAA
jgi:hypothetical protein